MELRILNGIKVFLLCFIAAVSTLMLHSISTGFIDVDLLVEAFVSLIVAIIIAVLYMTMEPAPSIKYPKP